MNGLLMQPVRWDGKDAVSRKDGVWPTRLISDGAILRYLANRRASCPSQEKGIGP